MVLSIIIINYNAKHFLEQCLCSVDRALEGMDAETLVVDNHSEDGSLDYLRPKFPEVIFLANAENLGYARANNLGLYIARGKNVLFLNPDTLVTRESISYCLSFLQKHPEAGAVGLRMIDGRGHFLPESKRAFPYPSTAFYKLFGLAALFPRSKTFASYYLGHLPEREISKVDVVAGAFMLLSKDVLHKTGAFDESFFLYGEDIDLSYRVQQAGFSNYYLGSQTILHFKGESTPKDAKHLKLFYKAMEQFIAKWFRDKYSFMGFQSLRIGIQIRKILAEMSPKFQSASKPKAYKYWLTGDPLNISETIPSLERAGKIITKESKKASRIIFCEGKEYSFYEIIRQIQERNHSLSFAFHGLGTHSIVGSPAPTSMGEVILL
ncbi:MAG: glycosyltransferase family 2 protein [Chitinophagales bacterium]